MQLALIFEKLPEWNSFGDFKPLLGKLLIIFRYKQKKYVVGKMEDNQKGNFFWRTESGNLLKFDEKDQWMYFSPVIITTNYD